MNSITKIYFQRWYTKVMIIVEDFEIEMTALVFFIVVSKGSRTLTCCS